LESRFPIKNSNDFTVEVFEKNGEKKKFTLEELAKIVPTYLSEGVVSPEIKDDKLTIVTHKKIDESYSNKILIKTGDDSFVVIPKYLIEKAREEEKKLKMEEAKKKELNSCINPTFFWGTKLDNPSLYCTIDRGNNIDSSNSMPEGTILEPGGTIKISNNSQSNDQGPITVKIDKGK
jgi:hypothetical protein